MSTADNAPEPKRIALVGYGRMGQAIDTIAQMRGHSISHRIDRQESAQLEALSTENTDVVIEFTHPEAVLGNLHSLLALGIPVVTGTTGWDAQREEVAQRVAEHNGSLVYAANFSLGVNVLFALNRALARWLNPYPQYDPYIEERHHLGKADSPSGTALHLAQDVLAELNRKTRVALPGELIQRPPEPEELSMGVTRAGGIPGTHTVGWHSSIDSLEISHTAHSREGFALGAVLAAERMEPEMGFVNFADLLDLHL